MQYQRPGFRNQPESVEAEVSQLDATAGGAFDLGDDPFADAFVKPAAAYGQQPAYRAGNHQDNQCHGDAQQDPADGPHLNAGSR